MIKWIASLSMILAATASITPMAQEAIAVAPDMKAPDFTVEQLDGVRFTLDENPTVIWFLVPWCSYMGSIYPTMASDCDDAAARLRTAHRDYGDEFRWLGLSFVSGATPGNVVAYQEAHDIPFPVAIDEAGAIYADYGVMYSPTVVVIVGGNVVYRAQAGLERLEETIRDLTN